MKMKPEDKSLEERIRRYTSYILDFQPGTDTGYSPMAGFDILGYIVSLVSGKSFEEYLRKEVFAPLEMKDTTFFPNKEQEKRLVRLVKRKGNKLVDVTDTKEDTQEFCGMVLIGMKPDAADCMVRLRIMNIWRGCFAVMECIRENNF